MPRLALYGVAYDLQFELYQLNGVDLQTAAVDGGTDCTVRKDNAAEATATNDFVDRGSTYSLSLSATEMQAKEVTVTVGDTSNPKVYLDRVIVIQVIGTFATGVVPLLELAGLIDQGTLQSGSGTAAVMKASAAFADNELQGAIIVIAPGGTGAGQRRIITANVGATDTLTVSPAWTTNPGASPYTIFAAAPAPTSPLPDVNLATWLAATPAALTASGYLQAMLLRWLTDNAGGTPSALNNNLVQSDVERWANAVVNALIGGRVDSNVGAMQANVMTAAAAAADLTTELQANLATAASITSVLTDTATLLARLTAGRAGNLDNLDVVVSGRASAAAMAGVQADTDDLQARIPAALTAGGRMKASLEALLDVVAGATALDRSARTMVIGTVAGGASTTSIPVSSLTPAATVVDQFKGRVVIFDLSTATAALRGQAVEITGSAIGGPLAVSALTTIPAVGDTFVIV